MRRSLLVCLVGLPVVASAQRPTRTSLAPRLDSIVANFMESAGPSAISIAIVRAGDTLAFRGWGTADRTRGTAADASTRYQIGSLTKQFTSALVLRLVERERVTIDDSIGKHVPNLPLAWRGVTIGQLLNHTAGIPDDGDDEFRRTEPMSPDTVLRVKALTDALRFASGSRHLYSNTGYIVLGMLIERLYGGNFADVVERELARPLGLSTLRYCTDDESRAIGYNRNGAAFVVAPTTDVSHSFSAGGLCAAIGDFVAWNVALHTGRVVNAQSYALMTTPQGAAATARYGFALERTSYAGHDAIEHGGNVPGFVALNAWFPADSLSITVLTNTDPIPGGRATLMPALTGLALGLPLRIAPRALAIDERDLLKFTGMFEFVLPNRALGIQFISEGDHLVAQADGQTPISLRALSDRLFVSATGAIRFAFTVRDGKVIAVALTQNGSTFDGSRRR